MNVKEMIAVQISAIAALVTTVAINTAMDVAFIEKTSIKSIREIQEIQEIPMPDIFFVSIILN